MLTDTSGINSLSGYQVQPNVSNSNRSASSLGTSSSAEVKESGDTVDISSKAKELQTEYQRKHSELEQRKNSEARQLDRKYLLEKNELEREFRLKKQRLDINVYA
jgi:hypothetical protein